MTSTPSFGPNHAVATYRDVLLSYYPREVTIEALAAIHAAHVALRAEHAGGTVTLGVIGSGIALPRPEVRTFAARIGREASSTIRGECIVLRGHPFWVGMARSALRTIEILSSSWHPRQVFSELEPAAEWVLARSAHAEADRVALLADANELVREWHARSFA